MWLCKTYQEERSRNSECLFIQIGKNKYGRNISIMIVFVYPEFFCQCCEIFKLRGEFPWTSFWGFWPSWSWAKHHPEGKGSQGKDARQDEEPGHLGSVLAGVVNPKFNKAPRKLEKEQSKTGKERGTNRGEIVQKRSSMWLIYQLKEDSFLRYFSEMISMWYLH